MHIRTVKITPADGSIDARPIHVSRGSVNHVTAAHRAAVAEDESHQVAAARGASRGLGRAIWPCEAVNRAAPVDRAPD